MKIEYCELRLKDVVCVSDGRKLGRIIDCLIDASCGQILGIILPGTRGFAMFRNAEDTYIPWSKIVKIGDDVILVDICDCEKPACDVPPPQNG
ncbi:MAG: YlmC/YmxH family sporulation protein [Bacillota bacterium]